MKLPHYVLPAIWLAIWSALVTGSVAASPSDQDTAQFPDPASAPATTPDQDPDLPPPLPAPPAPPTEPAVPTPPLPGEAAAQAPVALPPPTPPSASEESPCNTADCLSGADKAYAAKSKPASIPIGPPAQRALAESHAWAENPNAMPLRDSGGRVVFPFSESAPTIVCTPLHVCDIELQPGESVQGAPHIGDSVRWRISPAVSGSEEHRTTHLIIKPTEAGLDTNLIVATDRRTYHLRLVSSYQRYVSSIGFTYVEEDQGTWKELGKAPAARGDTVAPGEMPTVAVNRLNFDYKIKVVKGKPDFKPLRAMDDGYHTYISMNEDLPQGQAPALIAISRDGEEQMVNYRLKGNIYIVDGMQYKIALISGVGGNQQRIELTRRACERRGWLGICWDAKE
jgi:P-type conjugative transfer protein TrbG